jgi:hypothetical protein
MKNIIFLEIYWISFVVRAKAKNEKWSVLPKQQLTFETLPLMTAHANGVG